MEGPQPILLAIAGLGLAGYIPLLLWQVRRRAELESAGKFLAMLQRQCHRELNELQVIAGWLQVGSVPRAREYVESMMRKIETDNKIAHVSPPELAAFLLGRRRYAESQGCDLDVVFRGPLGGYLRSARYVLYSLKILLERAFDGEPGCGRKWVLELASSDGHFTASLMAAGGLPDGFPPEPARRRLVGLLKRSGGSLAVGPDQISMKWSGSAMVAQGDKGVPG